MTIEYALTRTEIVQGYFRGLKASPKFLFIVLFYFAVLAILILASTGAFSRPLTLVDAIIFVAIVVGSIPLLSLVLFVRAKTSKRSLTISPEGISTSVGKLQGQTPWRKIKVVSVTDEIILIAGANGNAYFIPNRAFSSPGQRSEFVDKVRNWMNAPEPA
ncbi:MAG TPA: YcxB family protein [Acidobacteriaceae bacterium]|nr:YcxB family protein [Acidobacteriaceae bacterium]